MWLYILDKDNKPVQCDSFGQWHEWIQNNNNNRTVASHYFEEDETHVLTVFLGHSSVWSDRENPYTFQTMIVGGNHHMKERYYATWEQAEEGHKEIVAALLENTDPVWPEELPEIVIEADRLMDFYGVIH